MSSKSFLVDKDKGFLGFFRRAQEIKHSRVKVGVLADKGGTERHEGSNLTKAEIATILEFGTEDGHIPARPAVRSTFDEKREELAEIGKKLISEVLTGKMDVERALGLMGAKLAADIKGTITSGAGITPPNAESTIENKGSSRPWVDTGAVVNAIAWSVNVRDTEE